MRAGSGATARHRLFLDYTTIPGGVKRYVRIAASLLCAAPPMIAITGAILFDESEIEESFIRASGPGGQNVNKVASAVQLRLDLAHSPSLPEAVRARALRLAGRRATPEGVLVITARRWRSQARNRADALERLVALIRRAAAPPLPRRPTRPSAASRERRLEAKARRSEIKSLRRRTGESDGGA